MVKESSKRLIEELLSQPDAPIILDAVTQQLIEERKKREAFYNDITDAEKVEFINGEIIVHSPVKKEHNDATSGLFQMMSIFVDYNDSGYLGIEKIMIKLTRNDYEPDICFFKKEKSKNFEEGQSLFPVPDLVVEVLSKGTFKNDRGVKFEDYQIHEIEEYWIIDPIKKTLEQYRLDADGDYELILKSDSGSVTSKVIEGFSIPIEAIFDKDKRKAALRDLL